VILLLAAGVGAWFALSGGPPRLEDDAARKIAEAFLDEVRAGKPDAAWAATTAEFKSIQGKDTFRAFVKAKPALKGPAAFDGCQKTQANGLTLAVCTFKPAKGPGAVKVTLAPEQGQWKVERLAVE
jgi:hypothetical protein